MPAQRVKPKLIVILGPTASGKSEMAVKIAKKFNGEVVSADSRQIYKGLDIGTGKISPEERQGVPHHLLDIVHPKQRFTVVQYKKLALNTINQIQKRGKLPILCGGTGFYIQAVVDRIEIPQVKPDWNLRKKLEKKPAAKLYQILKKLDPQRAKTIEKKNPRRLIRAIEIAKKMGKVPLLKRKALAYPVLMIGIKIAKNELRKRIKKRTEKMMKTGLENEAKKFFKKEIIGYQEWKDYFAGKITRQEVADLIQTHTLQYAKRQMTWFKKDKRIKWVKNQKQAEKLVKEFLKK